MAQRAAQLQGQLHPRDISWPFWPLVPLYPYSRRRTIRKEVIKDQLWTFDQLQGILYVVVPIRMTVVKLDAGGLLVYAPVAPTRECVGLVQELVAEHGDVKYIILPTVSGLEHKVFVGPFARCFPKARVFVAPYQWSFPLDLPLNWLGFPNDTQLLPEDSTQAPFANQFDYKMLGPIELGLGSFGEVAFFDRRSRTLLLTDSVVAVPEDPPAIAQLDPYPLLFHAKDRASDIVEDDRVNRCKGWQRISLFAFYFRPAVLETMKWSEAFGNAVRAGDRSAKAYFGLFPFQWDSDWKRSFDALRGNGHLFVPPVLQSLILNRAPKETLDWANCIASWDFKRIIPCHFDSPVLAKPHQLRQAFSFLEKQPAVSAGVFGSSTYPLPEEDFKLLKRLDESLSKLGIVPPAKNRV